MREMAAQHRQDMERKRNPFRPAFLAGCKQQMKRARLAEDKINATPSALALSPFDDARCNNWMIPCSPHMQLV